MNTETDHIERIHAIIVGQVQGVGFRYFVKRQCELLDLTGWVRNLPEGQVEVMAEGNPSALDNLMKLLSLGPPGAIVIEVTQTRSAGTREFKEFRVTTDGLV